MIATIGSNVKEGRVGANNQLGREDIRKNYENNSPKRVVETKKGWGDGGRPNRSNICGRQRGRGKPKWIKNGPKKGKRKDNKGDEKKEKRSKLKAIDACPDWAPKTCAHHAWSLGARKEGHPSYGRPPDERPPKKATKLTKIG